MCLTPVYVPKAGFVKCGKCLECLANRSNEWAYRIMLEAKQHADNCFITLTYDEANLPEGASLKRMDLQKFIKRLRKFLAPKKIRYFYSGEYGSKGRPHYHIIVFGWIPDDMYFFCYDKKKTKLYRSPTIEKLWTLGLSSLGYLTFESAKYCAKYMQKNINSSGDFVNPFIGMSTNKGLGYAAIDKKMLNTGKIYHNGKYIKIPRYFRKVLEVRVPDDYAFYKKNNQFSLESYGDYYNFIDSLILRNKKFQKHFKKTDIYKDNKTAFNNVIKEYIQKLEDLKQDEAMRSHYDDILSKSKKDFINSKDFFEKGLTFDSIPDKIFNAYKSVRKSP